MEFIDIPGKAYKPVLFDLLVNCRKFLFMLAYNTVCEQPVLALLTDFLLEI